MAMHAKPGSEAGAEASVCAAGVVLAGGQSRRMGRDKALLNWQGAPLIEHQIALLRAAGMEAVYVSGERPDYQGIADAVPRSGPVGGVASIARALTVDANLLIIPVDMPRLTPALLSALYTANPAARCLRYAGHVLPMRLRLDARSRACIHERLSQSESRARSLHALQQAMGFSEIPLPHVMAGQLIDCNTAASFNEVAS
jgi:molybdopterin-guanine dinucleotide biosynthesis protein A